MGLRVSREKSSAHFTERITTTTLFQDTKVNATILARENLSASDADLDIIYYELTTIVPVSIFAFWGKKMVALEKSLCFIQKSSS